MSVFGFVSLFIVVISVAVIILHYRLMRKRAPVDVHFDQLEELLRQWIENLYHISPVGSGLYNLCDQYIDLEFSDILSAMPEIHDFCEQEQQDSSTNIATINDTISALNRAISEYNAFIAKTPATVLMAHILGLKTMEPIEPLCEKGEPLS